MIKNICCNVIDVPTIQEYNVSDELYYLTPSFFDIQVNGYNRISLDTGISLEKLEQISNSLLADGVTHFIPTLITATPSVMEYSLSEVRKYMQLHPGIIPGMHIEGPFIDEEKRGIHSRDLIRRFSSEDLRIILEYKDAIAYITVSPKALDESILKILISNGVRLSIGHTSANYSETKRAIDYGFDLATHLYNAMSFLKNGRTPMAVEAIYNSRIYAGVICDGIHVAFPIVKIAHEILNERFILTTDALAAAGVRDSKSFEKFKFADKIIYNDLILGCTDEEGTIAGSRLTMLDGVKNLVNKCNISLVDAIYAATISPRKCFAMDEINEYLILDKNLELIDVFCMKNRF
ncbi:MAG: N-acetylglucosamine-6-phosphate deacetylase [Succinivibrionaceae bacterium]